MTEASLNRALTTGGDTKLKPTKKDEQPSTQAMASGAKPYTPKPLEVEAFKAFKAAKAKSAPRLTLTCDDKNVVHVGHDHPDDALGAIALARAIGTTDPGFYIGLLGHLVNASGEKGPSEAGVNFMLSVIKGIEPRDQIEAMLAAQMAAVHVASMTFARRLATADNIIQRDSADRTFNKLTRTFVAQMSALKEYRSKGEQKMTVQHVHVAEGGQAIVGNVNAPTEGGGAREKSGEQPHALGYAPGVAMPCEVEAERATVPSASRSGG